MESHDASGGIGEGQNNALAAAAIVRPTIEVRHGAMTTDYGKHDTHKTTSEPAFRARAAGFGCPTPGQRLAGAERGILLVEPMRSQGSHKQRNLWAAVLATL